MIHKQRFNWKSRKVECYSDVLMTLRRECGTNNWILHQAMKCSAGSLDAIISRIEIQTHPDLTPSVFFKFPSDWKWVILFIDSVFTQRKFILHYPIKLNWFHYIEWKCSKPIKALIYIPQQNFKLTSQQLFQSPSEVTTFGKFFQPEGGHLVINIHVEVLLQRLVGVGTNTGCSLVTLRCLLVQDTHQLSVSVILL